MSSTSDETRADGLPRLPVAELESDEERGDGAAETESSPASQSWSEPAAGSAPEPGEGSNGSWLPPAPDRFVPGSIEAAREREPNDSMDALDQHLAEPQAEVVDEPEVVDESEVVDEPAAVDEPDGDGAATDVALDETPEAVVRIDPAAVPHEGAQAAPSEVASPTPVGDAAMTPPRPLTPAEELGALVSARAPMPAGVPPTPIAPQPTGPIAVPVEPESTAEIMRRPKRPARPLQQPISVRRARPRVRKVSRIVRHVDTWSVFKVALVFNLFLLVVLLTAGVLLWQVALSTGTIDNVERAFENVGWEVVNLRDKGGAIFNNSLIAGLFITIGATGLAVLAATLFNLITDLVGGVRVTVLEEEVQARGDRQPVPVPSAAPNPAGPPTGPTVRPG